MKTEIEFKDNEVVTISLERYEHLKRYERLVYETEQEMLKTKNKLTKEIAITLLNNFRSYIPVYMGGNPYKLEIID